MTLAHAQICLCMRVYVRVVPHAHAPETIFLCQLLSLVLSSWAQVIHLFLPPEKLGP